MLLRTLLQASCLVPKRQLLSTLNRRTISNQQSYLTWSNSMILTESPALVGYNVRHLTTNPDGKIVSSTDWLATKSPLDGAPRLYLTWSNNKIIERTTLISDEPPAILRNKVVSNTDSQMIRPTDIKSPLICASDTKKLTSEGDFIFDICFVTIGTALVEFGLCIAMFIYLYFLGLIF